MIRKSTRDSSRLSQSLSQSLSMMVDGELDRQEIHDLVPHLRKNEDLKTCWENYHLIGDALRKNLPPFILPDLSDRISAAIDNEPTHFLPQKSPVRHDKAAVSSPRTPWRFALAASVTALAVVGMMKLSGLSGIDGGPGAADASMTVAALSTPQQMATAPEEAGAEAVVAAGEAQVHTPGQPVVVARVATQDTDAAGEDVLAAEELMVAAVAEDGEVGVNYPAEAADLYDYLVNYQRYAQTVSLQSGFYPTIQLVGYSPQ